MNNNIMGLFAARNDGVKGVIVSDSQLLSLSDLT